MAGINLRTIRRPLVASSMGILWALAGCNLLPVSQGTLHAAAAEDALPPAVSEQSQLMYEVMIAELAGRRGYVDIATEGYYNAAMRTDDPRVSERATRLAVWGRRWQQAEVVGKRWAELEPSSSDVHQLLSQVYMRQGNSAQAADELEVLIADGGEDVAATLVEIYQFLLLEPNRTVALETMKELRDRTVGDAYVNVVLAQLALESRDLDLALEAADRAIELKPDNDKALLLRAQVLVSQGNANKGFEELQQAIAEAPENLDLRMGHARLLVEARRFDAAAKEFDVVYDLASENGQAVFTLGLLALESRRNRQAEKYFSKTLELGEFNTQANFYLAQIADSQQNLQKAIEHYEQVQSGDNAFEAQIRAAELYGKLGQVDTARQRLQQMGQQSPSPEVLPRLVRAEGRILLDAGQPDEAVAVLGGGLELFPDNNEIRYARAIAADRAGDKKLFESDLRALIEKDPDNAHAMNALGYYYADNNSNLDEAETLLVKANELLPQDPAILDSLGWLRYRQGQHEEAKELLNRAYSILKDTEIAAHLGEVMWVSGDQQAARELWQRALAEKPGDPKLESVMERFDP